ncbi:MAG: outer membrane protein [Gemmatimonadales bacterium]
MKGFVKAAAAIVLGLAIVAAPAQAQKKKAPAPASAAPASSAAKPITWNAGVGLSLPTTTGLNTGFNVRLGATFTPHAWPVWLRPEAAFDHFGISCGGGSCSSTQIGVGAYAGYDFKTASSFKPYGLAGLGFVHTSSTVSFGGFTATGSTTNLGLSLGGGARMPVGSMTGYGELRFNSVSGGSAIALTVGLMFGKK